MDDFYSLDAMIARRLFVLAEKAEWRRKHPLEKQPTFYDDMGFDQVVIGGDFQGVDAADLKAEAARLVKIEQDQVRLKDLIARLKELEGLKPQEGQAVQSARVISESRTVEWEISMTSLDKVEGLVVRNRTLAETDRYRFDFTNGTELTITDKWSSRSTRIWGDPHIDTNDEEGENNGDFKDLTGSNSQTTFMLLDKTRLTFTARDDGIIEEVDIFNGSQHVKGVGSGSAEWTDDGGLFTPRVEEDAIPAALSLGKGDVVHAGGDGNDWFDSSGNLVWGTTTGRAVNRRPDAMISFQASLTVARAEIQVDRQV